MTSDNWPLKDYIPSATHHYCIQLQQRYQFITKITAPRKTKLGDFRFRADKKKHLITINCDLNPYAFLIVYLHEVAHCITSIKHGPATKPHGGFWQQEMMALLDPVVRMKIFPRDIEVALYSYLKAPKATSCAHPELTRALRRYDPPTLLVALEEISEEEEFLFQSRRYRKMNTRRTRVACLDISTNRVYLISKLAMVYWEQ